MKATNTTPRRHYTNCRICGQEMRRPIVVTHGLVLCKTHKRQMATRRRAGVSTAQLSADWGDRLANWRERPAELEQETTDIAGWTDLQVNTLFREIVEKRAVMNGADAMTNSFHPKRANALPDILRSPIFARMSRHAQTVFSRLRIAGLILGARKSFLLTSQSHTGDTQFRTRRKYLLIHP